MKRHGALLVWMLCGVPALAADRAELEKQFRTQVAPVLERHCVRCHQPPEPQGELDLTRAATVIDGQGDGWVAVPGKPSQSSLLEMVSGAEPEMPKNADPLAAEQVAALRTWIEDGAVWPDGLVLKERRGDWWSLRPLARPLVPEHAPHDAAWIRTPIDAFVLAKLREQGLSPSPEADRRTLIRRLTFDLWGLPPEPGEVERFVRDDRPQAYQRLVERLLASPHYGERWARHWLDVVHYGDTHGFDKDKVRPHSWPYRDYVIRAFNQDKPYSQFVKQQLAGDWFAPGTKDGIVALGFLAAGPFDWVGQIEVRGGTVEKKRVRNLDRDDMVASTMNTFVSLTAQCARCHNHKFDPITQEDYYSLQAVFAGVDRANRAFDRDPETARQRAEWQQRLAGLQDEQNRLLAQIHKQAGPELNKIDRRIKQLAERGPSKNKRPEYGYHSRIEPRPDVAKWVQVDLGRRVPIEQIVFVGCHDEFAGIGAGFGFPVRYKIELSDDAKFESHVVPAVDHTGADVKNPGVVPQSIPVDGKQARYVRVTATRLAERKDDYIFALAELIVKTPDGANAAAGKPVTALDSIEAPVRWRKSNLVDGIYYGMNRKQTPDDLASLNARRKELLDRSVDPSLREKLDKLKGAEDDIKQQLASLPPQGTVFAAATDFTARGNFRPTGGRPREIHVLNRGSVKSPGPLVGPGTAGCLPGLPSRFDLDEGHDERQRRAALAEWIVDERNPLTWRSLVNRVWHYHFGRGIVDSPNDFGRMGSQPTHPELLDWLAAEFRDRGQSIKQLHRLIVNSATYRQVSRAAGAAARIGEKHDAGNRYLWKMNRRRLEAEAVRDSVLVLAGKLDRRMGGPGFRAFGFKDDHSPHYKYHEHDPDDPASHRRSVYRFIVRSVPDPFMTTLDCADPSLNVAKRNETLTALQALALLNNKFTVRMAEHFAARVERPRRPLDEQVRAAFRLAFGRSPSDEEHAVLSSIARKHGMPNACRVMFNMNEFLFVD